MYAVPLCGPQLRQIGTADLDALIKFLSALFNAIRPNQRLEAGKLTCNSQFSFARSFFLQCVKIKSTSILIWHEVGEKQVKFFFVVYLSLFESTVFISEKYSKFIVCFPKFSIKNTYDLSPWNVQIVQTHTTEPGTADNVTRYWRISFID